MVLHEPSQTHYFVFCLTGSNVSPDKLPPSHQVVHSSAAWMSPLRKITPRERPMNRFDVTRFTFSPCLRRAIRAYFSLLPPCESWIDRTGTSRCCRSNPNRTDQLQSLRSRVESVRHHSTAMVALAILDVMRSGGHEMTDSVSCPDTRSECRIHVQRVVVDVPAPWLWRCLIHNLGQQDITTKEEAWRLAKLCGPHPRRKRSL